MEEMAELVSVIVPVYNAESSIERCAWSLISQTCQNIEVIFIDDCSQDKSVEILNGLLAKAEVNHVSFRIVRQKENRGPNAARKVGVWSAAGEWCVFVDSDDWVEPAYIEHLVDAVNRDVDFAISGVCYDYADADKSRRKEFVASVREVETISPDAFREIINFSYPFGKIFRTEVIREKQLWVEDISLHEDTALVMGYLRRIKRVAFIAECDYHYVFQNECSLSRKYRSSQELLSISLEMFRQWDLLFRHFCHIRPIDMRACIQRYGLSQLLQAVLVVYSVERESRPGCLRIIGEVRKRSHEFNQFYRPTSFMIRILVRAMLKLPVCVVHPLFRLGACVSPAIKQFRGVCNRKSRRVL